MSITLALALSCMPALEAQPLSVDLNYRSFRNWKFELPREDYRPLSGGIELAGVGKLFESELVGTGLRLDSDADGAFDLDIKGTLDPVTKERSARATLTWPGEGGEEVHYSIRLLDKGKGWTWACGGAQVAKVGGQKVRLFDLNGNGLHHDLGQDAVVIGSGTSAILLSETMHVDGQLHTAKFAEDGSSFELVPFEGSTGMLDLRSKLKTNAKLIHGMVRSTDGKHCFDVAGTDGPFAVPLGEYQLVRATLGLGKSQVFVDGTKMKAMSVAGDNTLALEWGGPVRAEFDYERSGSEVTFKPELVWWIGAAGERYVGWNPIGKSPEFTIIEKKLGTEIEKALFPGSC